MNIKRVATSTIAAGFVGATVLGLGMTAGTASAAPQQWRPTQHAPVQYRPSQDRRQEPQQREVTVYRDNYGPFFYRGRFEIPSYDGAHRAWGFYFDRTFVRVLLAHR